VLLFQKFLVGEKIVVFLLELLIGGQGIL